MDIIAGIGVSTLGNSQLISLSSYIICICRSPSFLTHIKETISLWKMGDSMIGPRLYSCYKCRNHVALHDDIVSKGFQSKNGRAFLFSHAQNVYSGVKEDRQLITGLHVVADVHCADCREVLGWKYEKAYEESQKYKEGKVVLEKYKIVKQDW